MFHQSVFKPFLLAILGMSFLLAGCGKKAAEQKRERITVPIEPVDTYLEKQDVNCEENQACPNYIAKIVIIQGERRSFCTGFLTEEDVVATSASCLPGLLRLAGQDCSKDVHLFFPKTANRPAERAACAKVLVASDIDGQDPILWRDDIAFLQLEKPLPYRRQAQIIREGIQNGKSFTTWMIDQQDDFSAIVKRSSCEAVHNNYINPLVLNESSPNMLLSDCEVTRGGTGAPIIDNRGKVRGVVSIGMDPKLRKYIEQTGLLTQKLKEFLHATNFACAPTSRDTDQLDEKECAKDLTYGRVDRLRSEMLSTNMLFGELKKKLEELIKDASKYVIFGVKLIPKGDLQETEIYPKCFRPLDGWIESLSGTRNTYVDSVTLPKRSFRRSMDQYARVLGTVIDDPSKNTNVQFSLKNLRAVKKSSILMWNSADSNNVRNYANISEACSASLL